MRSESASNPGLDYLQQSPVRGQLEPYDEKTTKGWRYIQCTDTPNELKVLLPPGTAAMYEELLQAEIWELNKEPPLYWERILEIRHLKDRMIRKCQRLSKTSPLHRLGRGQSFAFQTLLAPTDFRLKEMEKWLRTQIRPTKEAAKRPPPPTARRRDSYCCSNCARGYTDHSGTHPLTRSYSNLSSLGRAIPIAPSAEKLVRRRSTSSRGERTSYIAKNDTRYRNEVEIETRYVSRSYQDLAESATVEHEVVAFAAAEKPAIEAQGPPPVDRLLIASPPPLPHPFRYRGMSPFVANPVADEKSEGPSVDGALGATAVFTSVVNEVNVSPPLRHRRSSLKRTKSGDSKTVSWAPDFDLVTQLSKYEMAAREAKSSGKEWEQIHATYVEQLAGLDELHQKVTQSLERLRLETKQLEWVEETIKGQRAKLQATCEQLEHKQNQYSAKVQTVLDETKQALSHVGDKPDRPSPPLPSVAESMHVV